MFKKIVYIIILIAVLGFFGYCSHCADTAIDTFKYDAKGKNDPFIPLIGQEKAKVTGLEGVTSVQDVTLEGIAIGPLGRKVAILNGQMVKDNDKFGLLQVKKISQKSVEISIEGKDYTLDLEKLEEGVDAAK